MTDHQHQPDDPAARAFADANLDALGLLDRARARTLGPDESTDPRRALIRTDPGRHAANRGPAFGGPGVSDAEAVQRWRAAADAQARALAEAAPIVGPGWELADARPGVLLHRCPDPEPSHDGWWFGVGLGTGVLLAGLLVLVVSWW